MMNANNTQKITNIYDIKRVDPDGPDASINIGVPYESITLFKEIFMDSGCSAYLTDICDMPSYRGVSGYFGNCYETFIPSLILHGFRFKIIHRGYFSKWIDAETKIGYRMEAAWAPRK